MLLSCQLNCPHLWHHPEHLICSKHLIELKLTSSFFCTWFHLFKKYSSYPILIVYTYPLDCIPYRICVIVISLIEPQFSLLTKLNPSSLLQWFLWVSFVKMLHYISALTFMETFAYSLWGFVERLKPPNLSQWYCHSQFLWWLRLNLPYF